MIVSQRRVEAERLDAFFRSYALVHSRYRLHAIDNGRVVSDDELLMRAFDRAGHSGRPMATVLLEGEARISALGRREWLRPGELMLMPSKTALAMRQQGASYRSVAFEWDVDWLGARPAPFTRHGLSKSGIRVVDGVWKAVVAGKDGSGAVATLVDLLASVGAPLTPRPESDYREEVPAQIETVSRALDKLLSNIDGQPMTQDLEELLGLSARHVNRVVAAFNERYGFNSSGWRDTRNRRKLMMGASFMTVPGAMASYVAKTVGYRSAEAFSRALTNAKLPPPSLIREAVDRL